LPTLRKLTETEDRLKTFLLDVATFINSKNAGSEPVVLRWAGGWVRDSLLGKESDDIDVAVNVLTGAAFAEKLYLYVNSLDDTVFQARYGLTKLEVVGRLHVVKSNPEQSKHLETATLKIFGYSVDFANLRTETYTADSRNPIMKFGTAQEDAFRRDATINALFYNLNEDAVEDFTEGRQDMANGVIRTPLDPLVTFTDDPLRVLRLVRFAGRLGFTIDAQTETAMVDERVLKALKAKITRERVGAEVEKMLKGIQILVCRHHSAEYNLLTPRPQRPQELMPQTHWRSSTG
jgi:tRNA nucleotidyltransferase (CCA-adding enzyme)